MDWATVASLLGAAGIGSAVTQYLGGGKERRAIRANVLTHLANVESARWCSQDTTSTIEQFRVILHAFQTAALIARLPRESVRQYMVVATIARLQSEDATEVGPEGGIDSIVARVVVLEAEAIASLVWSPWRRIHLVAMRKQRRMIFRALHLDDQMIGRVEEITGRFGFELKG